MKNLKNLKQYTPNEPAFGKAVAYLHDEDGNDWYDHQKEFAAGTLKVAYDAEGIIWAVSRDVSMLWPINLSVVEVSEKSAPSGLSDTGEWVFNGKKITPRTYSKEEYKVLAQAQKELLLEEANKKTQAWQTQLMLGMINDTNKASLISWMEYVQKVQDIDVSEAPNIAWPNPPSI
ncbi:tail fiber assembly protein [Serratia plymuthica]|uniref:tail fiber assembly protein n=1 Tax=Serratia plymuthica TaxID=82996 RepID=UPI00147A0979|nr:tail fiber assembly protein [Serratia plymuthica]